MRSAVLSIAIASVALLLTGCRQAAGPVPTPKEQERGDIRDIGRDLEYIATGRDAEAPQYLVDDLRKYAPQPSAFPAVDELSRRAATVLPGRTLTAEAGQRLGQNLWVSVAARELSERQIENLQNDVQALLMSVGVAEEGAQSVAAQVGEVQRTVTDRSRRWYEWF